mmetsp:Transcript_118183/g.346194  ORF Transcript_118183/g.346194 Transcript_118183/m.346194 type:complete len:217 (+) Transcript_118183:226-876(+)
MPLRWPPAGPELGALAELGALLAPDPKLRTLGGSALLRSREFRLPLGRTAMFSISSDLPFSGSWPSVERSWPKRGESRKSSSRSLQTVSIGGRGRRDVAAAGCAWTSAPAHEPGREEGRATLRVTSPTSSKSRMRRQEQAAAALGSAMGTVASPTRRSSVPSTLKMATFRNCSLAENGTRMSRPKVQSSRWATALRLAEEAWVFRSSRVGRPASLW